MKPELAHTVAGKSNATIAPFVAHIDDYLAGKSAAPVASAPSLHGKPVTVFFADAVLKEFQRRPETRKAYDAVVRFGFVGHSRGEKNGIVYQREHDARFHALTGSLAQSNLATVVHDLAIKPEDVSRLDHVKGVWHEPNGERLIGLYNGNNARVLFLGFARYRR